MAEDAELPVTTSDNGWRELRIALAILSLIVGLLGFMAVQPQRCDNSHRTRFLNDLKNVQLACMNFDSQNEKLAGDWVSKNGTVLHSWETIILPLLDESALSRRINLSEPWNAPVNQEAMKTGVVGLCYGRRPEFDPVTGYGLSHISMNIHLFRHPQIRRIDDLGNGASSTIFLGEICEGFPPWGQPGNFRDPGIGLNVTGGFGTSEKRGVLFSFGDGRVQEVSLSTDKTVLKRMATPVNKEF